MTFSTQKGLDALLALLEKSDTAKLVTQDPFQGKTGTDVAIGNEDANVIDGRRGDDVLLGKGGNDTIAGGRGSDLLFGGDGLDSLSGGSKEDFLDGGLGNDVLDGGSGRDTVFGGVGDDILTGGLSNDVLVGGDGVDTLTGGSGRDQFAYEGNLFANGTPSAAGKIRVLNTPDIIKDYAIGLDQFVIDKQASGMNQMTFQKGKSSEIAGDGNVIVLTDGFAKAGLAANAIAKNDNIKADEGVFVYFNTTLGLTRVVYSKDLSDGGDISVLANLDNQRGNTGLANINKFSSADFALG